jgi:hypothetical protein
MQETIPFPEKIIVSCVTKSKGPLTKIMRLDPETKELLKDGSECSMFAGHIKKIPVSSPAGFAKMLRTRDTNQAIVHGISQHQEARIVTKNKVGNHTKSETPVIARTKDYITYSEGPGVILFDHDKARAMSVGSEQALKAYSPEELLACLATVHPEIAKAAYVSTPSTSSCIYSAEGELLRGEGTGSHVYLFVERASDIPRYMEVLGERLFLAGFGRIEISRAGSLLTRTLIDLVVGSPERLDFVAGAVCENGMVQKLPEPVVKNGEMLDTSTLLDPTADQKIKYTKLLADLKEQAKPKQEEVVNEYIEKEANKLAKVKNITFDEAKEVVVSRQDHVLADDDILFFSHIKDGVSVADVLKDGEAFHGKSLADPLEPEYEGGSKTKAKFFWNDGNPNIHSYAHGSSNYKFQQFKTDDDEVNAKNDPQAETAMFDRFVFLASENKIIDTIGHDIRDSMMIERAFILSQAGSFHHYTDQEGNEKIMPLTKHWLMSENKKVASSLKYKPGFPLFFVNGDGRSYYNTFRFPHQTAAEIPEQRRNRLLEPWHRIMNTVFHEHRDYIEDWFAFSIQHPDKRTGIMPICISDVGLGKSLIMAIMSRVVGHQNFSNAKILDVTGLGKSGTQWGDWIFNKKISCIEEIDPEGETGISYKILDALKDIITNETLSLNLKGGKNGTFPVFSNIIGFSNHKNCVKIPLGDRRLFICDSTGQELLKHHEYGVIWDWMKEEDSIIAVYQYLLNREIGKDFIPGQAKMTSEKKSLQVDGRSVMQTAFDIVVKQYPCDLITTGEMQTAVAYALHNMDGGTGIPPAVNWNADKQFQAIMKTTTTLIAEGKRVRVSRKSGERTFGQIRALRNAQDWVGATNQEIRDAMHVEIPYLWISEEEEYVPF